MARLVELGKVVDVEFKYMAEIVRLWLDSGKYIELRKQDYEFLKIAGYVELWPPGVFLLTKKGGIPGTDNPPELQLLDLRGEG